MHASSLHARIVHGLYPGEGGWDAQKLAISIGTAVELLLKHALAVQSFHLLPDKFSVDTALTLDGKSGGTPHLPQLTTVAGLAAFERGNKLFGLKLRKEDFDLIFQVRNSALHLGVASTLANKDAFKQMVLITDTLFTYLNARPADRVRYWGGEDAEKFVRAIVDEAISEARIKYEQLVHDASATYQRWSLDLIEAGRAAVITQFAEVPPTIVPHAEEAIPQQCPACGNMGWVVYQVARGVPTVEYEDEEFGYRASEAYVERDGTADRFECGVCRLKLDRREYLVEAGVPLDAELDPDVASEQELAEYEEAQVESYYESMSEMEHGK